MFQSWPKRGHAGLRSVVAVRESLLYFSVKDAVPYFSRAGSLVQRNVLRAVGERAVDIVEAGTGGHVESML